MLPFDPQSEIEFNLSRRQFVCTCPWCQMGVVIVDNLVPAVDIEPVSEFDGFEAEFVELFDSNLTEIADAGLHKVVVCDHCGMVTLHSGSCLEWED